MTELNVIEARPEHAEAMVNVIHQAFAARPELDPPSTALAETSDSVARAISESGGLLVERRGIAVGAMLFDESRPGSLGFRRVSVDPEVQDRGVASALVGVAEDVADERGKDGIWLHVRAELPETVQFWTHRKYLPSGRDGTLITMGKTLYFTTQIDSADRMQRFAGRLAELLMPGDLLVLSGDLGAGKTTFTQGLGSALCVRGPITSPTFVIARTHPSKIGGPPLVHVDAYRLADAAEIDDLDLDATTEQAITVVEWGDSMAEQLAASWLHVRIEAQQTDSGDGETESTVEDTAPLVARGDTAPRLVTVRSYGPRWLDVPLRSHCLT